MKDEIICPQCGENSEDELYECMECKNAICDECVNICSNCDELFCDACYAEHKKHCL